MHSTIVKKTTLFLCILLFATLACDLSVNTAPTLVNTPIPVIDPQTPTPEVFISLTQAIPATVLPTTALPAPDGTRVFYGPLSLVLPMGLASGISGSQIERADGSNLPYWELTPGHTVIKLEGYLLQGKSLTPQIYVYPATGYAELFSGAFESMHRLRNVMNVSPASISTDQLPAVPFFNAAQVFASNIQPVSFQNGSGIRFLTEYAQYAASVNNQDLFYHFQGFTNDGEYYIIAVLPITVPVVADTSDAGAPLPPAGVPYPYYAEGPNADMQTYYASITDLLNATPSDAFSPTISKLDALVQSITITR